MAVLHKLGLAGPDVGRRVGVVGAEAAVVVEQGRGHSACVAEILSEVGGVGPSALFVDREATVQDLVIVVVADASVRDQAGRQIEGAGEGRVVGREGSRDVHRSAKVGRRRIEPVGVTHAGFKAEPDVVRGDVRAVGVGAVGPVVPAAALEDQLIAIRRVGQDIDHAAHGVVAPQGRPAAAYDLDALDVLQGDPVPLHIAEEGIVERHAVQKDKRSDAAKSAHRDIQRRGVGLVGRGDRHVHGGHAAQDVVERLGGRLRDLVCCDHRGACRHIFEPTRRAGRGDDDFVDRVRASLLGRGGGGNGAQGGAGEEGAAERPGLEGHG